MIDSIAFIKRQSPDWKSLAHDHRAGRAIVPERFLPDHPIAGFPQTVEILIRAWNDRFAIDFFTVRAIIAALSQQSLRSVEQADIFTMAEFKRIEDLSGSKQFFAFFHDDDDFFAPDMFRRLLPTDVSLHDCCVFPLYPVHADAFTFARPAMQPDFVLVRRQNFDFRFQSNNYGISSRRCSVANLRALKDHVYASAYADAAGFSEKLFSFAIGATVKTPASASQLPDLLDDPALADQNFAGFIARFSQSAFPADYDWLNRPLAIIARLLKSVQAGDTYDAIDDLLDARS